MCHYVPVIVDMCVICCVYNMMYVIWYVEGGWNRVEGCLPGRWQGMRSQGTGPNPLKPPGAVQASPGHPWSCPSGCQPRPLAWAESGESQAPAICAGRGSCPRGHTASILIKLGCHAGEISQEAPAAPILEEEILWGSACLSSLAPRPPGCV